MVMTPALITGAFAERMKFKTFLIFSLLWATIVYDLVAHRVWGAGGWLRNPGVLDFAVEPHDVPFVMLGAGMLWFGPEIPGNCWSR